MSAKTLNFSPSYQTDIPFNTQTWIVSSLTFSYQEKFSISDFYRKHNQSISFQYKKQHELN